MRERDYLEELAVDVKVVIKTVLQELGSEGSMCLGIRKK